MDTVSDLIVDTVICDHGVQCWLLSRLSCSVCTYAADVFWWRREMEDDLHNIWLSTVKWDVVHSLRTLQPGVYTLHLLTCSRGELVIGECFVGIDRCYASMCAQHKQLTASISKSKSSTHSIAMIKMVAYRVPISNFLLLQLVISIIKEAHEELL